MKKFSKLIFSLLVVSIAWASNSESLSPAGDTGQPADLFTVEQQIADLKADGSDVPEQLYRLVREYYGLSFKSEPASREGGDTVDDATVIDALPFNDTGSTSEANDDYDEICPYDAPGSNDVVYSYAPAEDMIIDITLCNGSEYATKLYLYENTVTPGAPFACNDDECPGYVSELIGLEVIGGNTYYIVVDGYGGESGNYVIDVTTPGGGETCADAIVVDALPFSVEGSTVDFIDDYDEICPYDAPGAPDVVYSFTPDADFAVDITLCNGSAYDTKLFLYENEATPGEPFACNDDECPGYVSELMGLDLTGGNTYFIVIDGYGGEAGDYILDITAAPLHGNCQFPPHTPDDDWSAGTSHNDGDLVDYMRADRFGEADLGEITGVVIAGLSLVQDGGWMECVADPMSFAVTFYEDGELPGEVIVSHQIEASPVATDLLYAGFPLYEYTLVLPTPIELVGGWFSVQTSGECWFLWMRAPDVDEISALSEGGGDWAEYGFDLAWCLTITEDVADPVTPSSAALLPNHPNPFNPVTTISYELAAPQQVELVVFNITGERVATLFSGTQAAGIHTQQFDGTDLPSGIYFYRLEAGGFSQTNRMLLVK